MRDLRRLLAFVLESVRSRCSSRPVRAVGIRDPGRAPAPPAHAGEDVDHSSNERVVHDTIRETYVVLDDGPARTSEDATDAATDGGDDERLVDSDDEQLVDSDDEQLVDSDDEQLVDSDDGLASEGSEE